MTTYTFAFTPRDPPGDWQVSLPPDASIGEVLVYATPLPPPPPEPGSLDFVYTGSDQSAVIPPGLTTVRVTLRGGSAGVSSGGDNRGKGGTIVVDVPVSSAGEILTVKVGGKGQDSGLGGWPDGGNGAAWSSIGGSIVTGGGGGSTSIWRSSTLLAIAGAAGSSGNDDSLHCPGGDGGYTAGSSGSCDTSAGRAGGGGTSSAGGAGGTGGTVNGNAGGPLQGADAPTFGTTNSDAGPGAGGGGLNGGGSGAAGAGLNNNGGGGGGGSSAAVAVGVTHVSHVNGDNVGNGTCHIEWT